jgi:hypothetical protein
MTKLQGSLFAMITELIFLSLLFKDSVSATGAHDRPINKYEQMMESELTGQKPAQVSLSSITF